jgi:hypothetical protein
VLLTLKVASVTPWRPGAPTQTWEHRGMPAKSATSTAEAPRSADEQHVLELLYPELCKNHNAIADFRAKLLALLPTVSGAAIFLLLARADMNTAHFAAIGLFGFAVTFGLFMYDLRGIQDCVELRMRASNIEARLGMPDENKSLFRDLPKPRLLGLADEVGAGWIVYSTVLGSWLYLAGSSKLWTEGRVLLLVGLYVVFLLAFIAWIGPAMRSSEPLVRVPRHLHRLRRDSSAQSGAGAT